MRLFFIEWSGKDLGMIDVVSELKKQHIIVYWSGANLDSEVNKSEFPETIFHDHFDALWGIPAKNVNIEKFQIPDKELFDQLHKTESIVLTMMNKRFERMPLTERKHLYYHYVHYWHGILNEFKPDAIIFSVAPHTNYDFVIYSLAKKLNIKTIFFENTAVNDRVVMMNDFEIGMVGLREEIKNNRENYLLKDLNVDLQEYYKRQREGKSETTLFQEDDEAKFKEITYIHMKKIFNKYSGLSLLFLKLKVLWASIKNFSFLEKIFGFLYKKFGPNLKKEYESVQDRPDFTKKFIYAPLNYQPERTSCPQGDVFADQILMIETLSAALPKDWLIYVKEHPTQWLYRGLGFFSYRFKGYYKAIARLKNVKLVPIKTNTYELTRNSQAVATVTGTAGWEAALRLKPAIIFGYPWYQHCPGVFRVHDFFSCKEVLNSIVEGFKLKEEKVINYLAIFDKYSFHGYIATSGKMISNVLPQQNSVNILSNIVKNLNE